MTEQPLPELEAQRAELYEQLAATGDFRRGSSNVTYRRCGKPNCACAQPDHPGHRPRHLWTRSVAGKTRGHSWLRAHSWTGRAGTWPGTRSSPS
jgi:hypothetical protein